MNRGERFEIYQEEIRNSHPYAVYDELWLILVKLLTKVERRDPAKTLTYDLSQLKILTEKFEYLFNLISDIENQMDIDLSQRWQDVFFKEEA